MFLINTASAEAFEERLGAFAAAGLCLQSGAISSVPLGEQRKLSGFLNLADPNGEVMLSCVEYS